MVQKVKPASIVLDSDGIEIYNWMLVPTLENLGGAVDRPVPTGVWAYVQAKLAGAEDFPALTIDTQDATVQMPTVKVPALTKVM